MRLICPISRATGAVVIGTESTANFARANGVPDAQILIAQGGDDLQLEGPVQVIPSLHGILPSSFSPPSTIFPANARPPFRLGQLFVEGGTSSLSTLSASLVTRSSCLDR